jgi:hypothetical protein
MIIRKLKFRYILGATVTLIIAVISLDVVNSYSSLPRLYNQSAERYDFWIGDVGPTGPVFSGPQQAPFICTSSYNGLGQPIVDDTRHAGAAVFPELFGFPLTMLPPVGYSNYCSIATQVDYFYFDNNKQRFFPLDNPASPPDTVQFIRPDNVKIPFVVRVERGTINRFLYSIAMLAPYAESLQSPQMLNKQAWNQKLVYKFQGGIGLGHYQGLMSLNKRQALHYEALKRGYAVAYSTGTRTSTHYNLQLAEETADMVKQHFAAIYGKPQYTVGLGGSGGAIQQYVIAQNHPGILDAAVAQESYPDMVTQTINVADCELLERYFDHEYINDTHSPWGDWRNRMMVEGVAANNTAVLEKWQRSPAPKPGASECVAGWRGTIPGVFNPNWTHEEYFKAFETFRFPDNIVSSIKWTYWNDLGNIYPRDDQGFAPNSWDNVGVQYGLLALQQGRLDKQSFLDLNACVGGWKQPQNMTIGNYPWNRTGSTDIYDPWDQANMNLSATCKSGKPAARSKGNLTAMKVAYDSRQVFTGAVDIPVIDIRWYLEPVLNMHHSIASFSVRARIQNNKGNHDNHVIWIAQCSHLDEVTLDRSCDYEPTGDALDVMDQWLENILNTPQGPPAAIKSPRAVDSCFDGTGAVIYAGDDAWDGILNENIKGVCTRRFPMYSTSRMQAGSDIKGSTFKCQLKSLAQALRDGTYGEITFNKDEIERLGKIFPDGVCDYSKQDMALVSGGLF